MMNFLKKIHINSVGENMTLTTTFNLLREAAFDKNSYKKLRKALKRVKNTESINLLTILDLCGIRDALWALRATEQNCDNVSRLMAADFAEELLPRWDKCRPNDNRLANAIQSARDFANGVITKEQFAAARSYDASCDESYDASAHADNAAIAAYVIAFAAIQEKQEQIFRSHLQPTQ